MKNIRFLAMLLVGSLTLGATACDDKDPAKDPALTVDTTPLTFVAAGDTKTITVTSDFDWTATPSESWLTVTPNADKTNFTATATANDGDQRTATITVDNGADTPKVINVTQNKLADPTLTVDTTPLNFLKEGDDLMIEVTSELDWTVVSSEPSWLGVIPSSDKTSFSVIAEANEGDTRTATITVDNGADTPKVINVTQETAYLTFIGAVGMNFGANWMNAEVGEFYFEAWSAPLNSFNQLTGEGYKIDGLTVYSAISEAMDVVDFAAGEYTVVFVTNTVDPMTIPSAANMPATVSYVAPGATTPETLSIVGGTMKVEGTVANHTIFFDFELKDSSEATRQLKGKFTGVIGLKAW